MFNKNSSEFLIYNIDNYYILYIDLGILVCINLCLINLLLNFRCYYGNELKMEEIDKVDIYMCLIFIDRCVFDKKKIFVIFQYKLKNVGKIGV